VTQLSDPVQQSIGISWFLWHSWI